MSNETGPAIKPGEQTSEFAMAQTTNIWTTIGAIAGSIAAVVPVIVEQLAPVSTTKWGMVALSVLGGLVTIASLVSKALNTAAYAQGRSLVKAAAARDVAPPKEV